MITRFCKLKIRRARHSSCKAKSDNETLKSQKDARQDFSQSVLSYASLNIHMRQ